MQADRSSEFARRNWLVGQRFGMLRIIKRHTGATQGNHATWECLCSCGNMCFVQTDKLTRSIEPTRSCGCGYPRKGRKLKIKVIS